MRGICSIRRSKVNGQLSASGGRCRSPPGLARVESGEGFRRRRTVGGRTASCRPTSRPTGFPGSSEQEKGGSEATTNVRPPAGRRGAAQEPLFGPPPVCRGTSLHCGRYGPPLRIRSYSRQAMIAHSGREAGARNSVLFLRSRFRPSVEKGVGTSLRACHEQRLIPNRPPEVAVRPHASRRQLRLDRSFPVFAPSGPVHGALGGWAQSWRLGCPAGRVHCGCSAASLRCSTTAPEVGARKSCWLPPRTAASRVTTPSTG